MGGHAAEPSNLFSHTDAHGRPVPAPTPPGGSGGAERQSLRVLILRQVQRLNIGRWTGYRACVLTLRNAPEWPALKSQLDLSLKELVESTYCDIFPPRVFLAQCNAPRLGSILKR